ncbi:ABC transporter ATP-binding protein [Pseudonocardia humida]|uniref:ABC transporter ATP-binding protein n=1 Tax=Pseudonocardia humida TaxID=2800819 RepID=A0ABT0ZV18_9PSEU|nr:ATP-binding cassette domain-containing protein [Pseudonocardia humida]MCO1654582.1 ABC transporter ATP-binding protein [Pseudonocardia humida]
MTLELHDLVAGYGGEPVLRGVDLAVADAEFVCVLGASGSGKTTLLRTVAGLHRPTAGRVVLGGHDLAGVRPERRRVGLVPQEGALFGHLDVAANVAFGLHRATRATRRARVAELLALVDMAGAQDRMPHELSGGQRQRIAVARALAPQPRVVLLDEPFAGLDAGLRADVRAQVADVLLATGSTAVLITHDQDEALSVGDRVAVLHAGRVAQVAEPRELYARPATAWLAGFVGEASLLPGRRDGAVVRTALGALPCAAGPPADVTAVVRPEQVRLGPPVPGVPTGAVHAVEFVGPAQRVRVELPGGLRVTARVRAQPRWRRGDIAAVSVPGPVHVVDGTA